MTAIPTAPVTPREFIEEVIPAIFAGLDLDLVGGSGAEGVDLKLGISLSGEDGGTWTLHFVEGELGVAEGLADDCQLTVLQTVADWRAGLWEGRPGLVTDAVDRVRAALEDDASAAQLAGAPHNPDALRELEKLPGRIDALIEGRDEADWRIGLRIGPGPIPEAADAMIRIGSAEAEAIRRGEVHPVEALITGQLRLEGDLGLILQLQAIAMAASIPPARDR